MESIKVFCYDGTLQCGMGVEIPLAVMELTLANAGIHVFSSEKRRIPLQIAAGCGVVTGMCNVYEISGSDFTKLPVDPSNSTPIFALWPFDHPTVEVYMYDGTLQCGFGKEKPLEEMESELAAAGVTALASRKENDGLLRIAMCGASTGSINVFQISSADFEKARNAGFAFYHKEPIVREMLPDKYAVTGDGGEVPIPF